MKRMTACLLTLVLFAPAVTAAPAPDLAKKKLEAMKKKLPEVVEKWSKEIQEEKGGEKARKFKSTIKLVRQISPTQAKITIHISVGDEEEMLTVFLSYYSGMWTSTEYRPSWREDHHAGVMTGKLMLAIDELGDK